MGYIFLIIFILIFTLISFGSEETTKRSHFICKRCYEKKHVTEYYISLKPFEEMENGDYERKKGLCKPCGNEPTQEHCKRCNKRFFTKSLIHGFCRFCTKNIHGPIL